MLKFSFNQGEKQYLRVNSFMKPDYRALLCTSNKLTIQLLHLSVTWKYWRAKCTKVVRRLVHKTYEKKVENWVCSCTGRLAGI